MNTRSQISRFTALPVLLLIYCAASLLHFVHNAVFLHDYPNMPASLSAARVYGAWCAVTAVGIAGYVTYRRGYEFAGLIVMAIYAALGFGGFDHYMLAPVSAHSFTMNLTIALEVAAAVLLLIAIARRLTKAPRRRFDCHLD